MQQHTSFCDFIINYIARSEVRSYYGLYGEKQQMNETDQWIGVDLDGTLAEYNDWIDISHIGKPIPLMIERVKRWIAEGKKVKIFTARVMQGQEAVRYIHEWLVTQGLPRFEVTNIEDLDMIEVWDDRRVRVEKNTGMLL